MLHQSRNQPEQHPISQPVLWLFPGQQATTSLSWRSQKPWQAQTFFLLSAPRQAQALVQTAQLAGLPRERGLPPLPSHLPAAQRLCHIDRRGHTFSSDSEKHGTQVLTAQGPCTVILLYWHLMKLSLGRHCLLLNDHRKGMSGYDAFILSIVAVHALKVMHTCPACPVLTASPKLKA